MTEVGEVQDDLLYGCKQLLQQQSFSTQDDIRYALIKLGHNDISQSTVSRLLTRLGVTKIPNAYGKKMYCLSINTQPMVAESTILSQINSIAHNEMLVVIKTQSGSAQLIARLLDHEPNPEILGTIAGIDTIMVAPRHIHRIKECEKAIKARLDLPL
jgi:transcriptional regulator of arginine metabolism